MARMQMELFGEWSVHVDAAVPESNLPTDKKTFPVVWLLHDEGGNHSDWFRFTNLEFYSEEAEVAVICMDTEDFEGDLGENVRALLANMLPLRRDADSNYIAGVGSGAECALKAMLKFPEKFGTAVYIYGKAGNINTICKAKENKLLFAGSCEEIDRIKKYGYAVKKILLDEYDRFAMESYVKYIVELASEKN